MAAKLKPLLPTLREKKRYLALEVITNTAINAKEIKHSIQEAIASHIGRKGLAAAGLLFVKHNKNKVVLRTAHTSVNDVKQALLFIKKINNNQVIVKSITTSGVLNKATKKIM
jgi:ribonuclease P/MRP protein subunit POP5